jgi:non-specific serine/threonine protein kinase
MQLFCDRAVAVDNQFALAIDTAPHVADICHRLDGIPLAIELAAARITVLSPQQLAQRLVERLRVLTAGDPSAEPRHRTMRALIDWSYELLSEAERRAFRRLSVFSAGFTLELAAAVCNDDGEDEIATLDILSLLVSKSLVQAPLREGAARYRILESTREYARERLRESGEEHELLGRHAQVFLGLAKRQHGTWQTTPDREWLEQVERDLENFRSALDWALGSKNDVHLGLQMVGAFERIWHLILPVEGQRWVMAAQQHVSASTPLDVVSALDFAEASLASHFGQRNASALSAARALKHYRELSDQRGIAASEHFIGRAQIHRGEFSEGTKLLERVVEAARSLGTPKSYSNALQTLALARWLAGDSHGAKQLYQEALTMAKNLGAERSAAGIMMVLAEVAFRDGEAATALQLADEGLAIFRELNMVGRQPAQYNQAAYLIALRRFDEALSVARDGITAACEAQVPLAVAFSLQHLAAIGAMRPETDGEELVRQKRSARILGYVESRLRTLQITRDFTEQQEDEAMTAALDEALGESEKSSLVDEGRRWTEDRAIGEAMLI